MTIPLHYLINDTLRPLAEKYFFPSIPSGFERIEHRSDIPTTGNFCEDNYKKIIEQRTDLILHEIERQLDDGLMVWCDVDVIFFSECAQEIMRLATGYDLLFQKELAGEKHPECNFGVQVVRRNVKTLIFYARLSLLHQATENNGRDQPLGNWLLQTMPGPAWGHLPLRYSSESNGGWCSEAVLYHANCTVGNSLPKKFRQLEAAKQKAKPFNKAA